MEHEINPSTWTEQQKEDFLKENRGFIQKVVSRFSCKLVDPSIDAEDLMQEAYIVFLNALKTYDPTKNTSFHTYAGTCITHWMYEKYRRSQSNKRIANLRKIPFESGFDANGEFHHNADSKDLSEALISSPRSMDELIMAKEDVTTVLQILSSSYSGKDVQMFISLAMKADTQVEIAARRHCSQAKISNLYNKMIKTVREELSNRREEGFSPM